MTEPTAPQEPPAKIPSSGAILPRPPRAARTWFQGLVAVAALYLFITAVNTMGHGLKVVAGVPASEAYLRELFSYVANPVAGLCVGVLLTSLVQSSSFTTSFTVGLVAAGEIQLVHAVPIIMGANVGTSVTNLLVSLANLRRRREFRRSLAGAIVHDLFNVLSVLLFMPLEVAFGILSRPALAASEWLKGRAFFSADPKKFNFIKEATRPLADLLDWLLLRVCGLSETVGGLVEAGLAVALLFVALWLLVKVLQGLLRDRLGGLFDRTLFRNAAVAFAVGMVVTAAVQSSSVTTSLVVPLVGAGVLRIKQVYPYTLGANIGTTITAVLAALGTAHPAAMGGALSHLLFNIYGTVVFWPLKAIPISLAKGFAKAASRRRILAAVYILVIFFVLPIILLIVVNLL